MNKGSIPAPRNPAHYRDNDENIDLELLLEYYPEEIQKSFENSEKEVIDNIKLVFNQCIDKKTGDLIFKWVDSDIIMEYYQTLEN